LPLFQIAVQKGKEYEQATVSTAKNNLQSIS
jgi:hypothetical protein